MFQFVKQRIKGVQNISQITKAMELVAATKMRRSQEITLRSRPYAYTALNLLRTLAQYADSHGPDPVGQQTVYGAGADKHGRRSLFSHGPVKNTAVVLVTSDKGLAGAFNSNVIKKFEEFAENPPSDEGRQGVVMSGTAPPHAPPQLRRGKPTTPHPSSTEEGKVFIAVGKKALSYLERKKYRVLQSFTHAGDFTTPEEVRPIAELLEKLYTSGEIDRAIAFSTHFRTALAQETLVREIVPLRAESLTHAINEIVPERGKYSELRRITPPSDEGRQGGVMSGTAPPHAPPQLRRGKPTTPHPSSTKEGNYLIEPSPEEVLRSVASHLLHMELYHLFMEANASEHAARRLAMKNASENAGELVETLTLTYNKLRQAAITKEITEITAGAEALK
jgi:F-type H+-transporting ATPase subunit gamma